MTQWKEIPITEIKNLRIGHALDEAHATGCTVLICEKKAPCGLDVRGGGPASRETVNTAVFFPSCLRGRRSRCP